ncbi:MAG TPA: hypothetical protein VJJ47_02595 [Candidatus Paceibacterota bacterium]
MPTPEKKKRLTESAHQHFSQAFNLNVAEESLDFFDLNLEYDSQLFLDPFLIAKSHVPEVAKLFANFGDFFRYVYDCSTQPGNTTRRETLRRLLRFPEPQEFGFGYTENSHSGSGLNAQFAESLVSFFIEGTATRVIREEEMYPSRKFNPVALEIFIEGIGPDSLSDLAANLFKKNFIDYTQQQCQQLGIPLKLLPLDADGFDFELMEWRGGGHYMLPENPLKPGTAILLAPKHLLRAGESRDKNIKSRVRGILKSDPDLSRRFHTFLDRKVEQIPVEDIRILLLANPDLFKRYLTLLSEERGIPYDFQTDAAGFLAIKKHWNSFVGHRFEEPRGKDCEALLERVMDFVEMVRLHYSKQDGWKDAWADASHSHPVKEVVWGRTIRGMGFAYFRNVPDTTFIPEAGSGNGPVDFFVVRNNCRIVIEIKKLENNTPTGSPPLPAYIHGMRRQLADYADTTNANHAVYITGQHWTMRNRPEKTHDERASELEEMLPEVESGMQAKNTNFKHLRYENIDLAPRPSASRL